MKERQILFSGEMVRAILDGRKTQTRRVAKVTSDNCKPGMITPIGCHCPRSLAEHVAYCPYGKPGDRFYVKEKHKYYGPSIHMPRWASRITLEIVAVRVERLQDISEGDIIAEGCPNEYLLGLSWFRPLWESINGPGSWEKNPFVWVIEFKRVNG